MSSSTQQMQQALSAAVQQALDPSYAPKILLMADSGRGKTTSILTLMKCGITPFVLATEQNAIQILKPYFAKGLHLKFMPPNKPQTTANVVDMLKKINQLSYENLTKVHDPFKTQHDMLVDVGMMMNDFRCDCCNKSWGAVTQWNTDRALVLDSLSGLSDMAFALVVGNKPVRAQPDYQVAQNALRMIFNIGTSMKCMFILVAHLSKETDEITGGKIVTANTVGQKLGPDLPRSFSDVILAKRNGGDFFWDTADGQATVAARHLPISQNLKQDFQPLVEEWKKRGGKIETTQV